MNPQFAVIDGGKKHDGIRVEVKSSAQSVDHWSFLDGIEAPMWVDLNSEANLAYHEIDDEWFHIGHPVHQCSACQLISAFSHAGEGGPPSPKLPPSVSRSRGKDYKSKEWGQSKCKLTFNKQHQVQNLVNKSSWANSGSGKEAKLRSGVEKLKENEGSKACSVGESDLTHSSGPNYSTKISTFGDSKLHPSSSACQNGESSSISTVTAEGSEHQQKKCVEVSSQIGRTSVLLTTLRTSLRRSCGTRQASRVAINGGRQSDGCKSSSSKSSVDSSSHPGFDGKIKEKTPDSRNVTGISLAPRNKVKVPNISKAPAIQVRGITSNCKRCNETTSSKETAKAKAQLHTLPAKVLMPRNVSELDHLTARKAKEKVGVGHHYPFASGITIASQKTNCRDKAAGCKREVQKASKPDVPQRSERRKLVCPKEMTTEQTKSKESTVECRHSLSV